MPDNKNPNSARLTRRSFAKLAGIALVGTAFDAQSATWSPSGPVKLVVPFAPGGAADALARLVEPGMRERLHQPVLVENKVGATGSIGADFVYKATADGTVLLVGNADGLSMYPHIAKTKFDPEKFIPIGPLGKTPFVLMGRSDLPVSDLKTLVALARTRLLTYATAGNGSAMHVLTAAFKEAAEIKEMVHVPYQGAGPALQAVVAGQVDLMMVPTAIAGPYRSRLKTFGITSQARFAYVQDVPTFKEQGLAVVGESWLGVLAPPNTRPEVISAVAQALREITANPEYLDRLAQMGLAPIALSQPEFSSYYLAAFKQWGDVIRAGDIKAD